MFLGQKEQKTAKKSQPDKNRPEFLALQSGPGLHVHRYFLNQAFCMCFGHSNTHKNAVLGQNHCFNVNVWTGRKEETNVLHLSLTKLILEYVMILEHLSINGH